MDLDIDRLLVLPIRISEPKLARADVLIIIKNVSNRVDLGHIEEAAGLDVVRGNLCPAADVGQPAEHAARRVYNIEFARESLRQVIEVGTDKGGVDPDVLSQRTRSGDARLAEVGTGDRR